MTRDEAIDALRPVLSRYLDDHLGDDVDAEAFGRCLARAAEHPLPDVLRAMLRVSPDLRPRFEPVFVAVVRYDVTWVDVAAAEMTAALLTERAS